MKFVVRFLIVMILWPLFDLAQLIWDPTKYKRIWEEAKRDYPEEFRRGFNI